MKKINKRGFTLIEMVIVIAIIVIISVVVYYSAAAYLGRAKSVTSSIEEHNSAISEVTKEIDTHL